jgi:hypothetical protein
MAPIGTCSVFFRLSSSRSKRTTTTRREKREGWVNGDGMTGGAAGVTGGGHTRKTDARRPSQGGGAGRVLFAVDGDFAWACAAAAAAETATAMALPRYSVAVQCTMGNRKKHGMQGGRCA